MQVAEQDFTDEFPQDIVWTVVEPIHQGTDERTFHYTTQVEAAEKVVSLFSDAKTDQAYYGITIVTNRAGNRDKFIRWTDEEVVGTSEEELAQV